MDMNMNLMNLIIILALCDSMAQKSSDIAIVGENTNNISMLTKKYWEYCDIAVHEYDE